MYHYTYEYAHLLSSEEDGASNDWLDLYLPLIAGRNVNIMALRVMDVYESFKYVRSNSNTLTYMSIILEAEIV